MFRLILTAGMTLLTAYVFWRFWRAFPRLGWWRLAAAPLLAALAGMWMIARWVDRLGWVAGAEGLKTVGAVWLVLAFWFVVAGLALELWNLLAWLAGFARRGIRRVMIPPRAAFITLSVLVVAAGVWGWFEAASIRVHPVVIKVEDLPAELDGLRVAQITDLHIGSVRSRQRLGEAVRLIRQQQPDLLVSTGDLVDGELDHIGHLAEAFADIHPPLGKYAVLGNHEVYNGIADSEAFHRTAGFELLRQETASPAAGLVVVGVDDPATQRRGGSGNRVDELPVLPAASDEQLVVLLKHQPRVKAEAVGRFDLQLSGHTHGGQVFPFLAFTRLLYPLGPGVHELGEGSTLFVSRGTGTWGPPLRLASPPEVTLITFRKAAVQP